MTIKGLLLWAMVLRPTALAARAYNPKNREPMINGSRNSKAMKVRAKNMINLVLGSSECKKEPPCLYVMAILPPCYQLAQDIVHLIHSHDVPRDVLGHQFGCQFGDLRLSQRVFL